MKTTNIYIGILFSAVSLFGLTACSDYLDVAPKSSLAEKEIFSSETGFQQALNGVYTTMATQSLYGDNLTMGLLSAFGQNYVTTNSNNPLFGMAAFNYTSQLYLTKSLDVWRTAYNAIAGVNNILKHTTSDRNVLSEEAYNVIRGEALALRAYLHFDLLRMFGKSTIVGATDKSIPYRISLDQYGTAPSTTTEVLAFVLKDLEEAITLLKVSDPILRGTKNRQIRMNYYAARSLEARALLYAGKTNEAYLAAKEVVDSGAFPFVAAAELAKTDVSRDRLLRGELIFTLRVRTMVNWVNRYFRFNGNSAFGLTRSVANIGTIYENSSTDVRRLNWFQTDQSATYPSKYWQTWTSAVQGANDSTRLDQLVPLIRISEIRLILAETAPSLQEGLDQVNAIREARVLPRLAPATLTSAYLMAEIGKEYEKDLYAEGQLFYYHKRRNSSNFRFTPSNFNTAMYVLPIPEKELEYNPTY